MISECVSVVFRNRLNKYIYILYGLFNKFSQPPPLFLSLEYKYSKLRGSDLQIIKCGAEPNERKSFNERNFIQVIPFLENKL